ncbi:MAG: hypothetical protein J0L99_04360 [Chitinophagales bacterium]|nr:hypothetical protein [Chitinophagales bacterium]
MRYKSSIGLNDITIANSSQIIGDIFFPPYKIKKLVFSNYFPKAKNQIFSHYTTLEALEGIIDSNGIWLTGLEKRFNEGEFNEFYKQNGMEGYRKRKVNGILLAESIVNKAYYISLVPKQVSNEAQQYLWNTFSKNAQGVKIEFSISNLKEPLKPRKIYYKQNGKIDLIANMCQLAKKYHKLLVFKDISSAGFFQLKNSLSIENEIRILIKEDIAKNMGLIPFTPNGKSFKVIKLDLGKSDFGEIKILNIVPGKNCNLNELDRIKKKMN